MDSFQGGSTSLRVFRYVSDALSALAHTEESDHGKAEASLLGLATRVAPYGGVRISDHYESLSQDMGPRHT